MAETLLTAADGVHTAETIAEGTYRIDELGLAECYLVCGSERALLIDTGCGYGDIAQTVRQLTALPVDVMLTHRHCDHAGGIGRFAEFYVHESDTAPVYSLVSSHAAMWLLSHKFTDKRIAHTGSRPRMIPFGDGFAFELGGRRIVPVNTPGHTRGSVVAVDEKEHIMFTGDNVNPCLWMQLPGCVSLEEWLPGAERTLALCACCRAYCGHGADPLSREGISACIESVRSIIDEARGGKRGVGIKRRLYEGGETVYNCHRVLAR